MVYVALQVLLCQVYIHPYNNCLIYEKENKKFKLERNGNLLDYEVSFFEREDFEKITISSFKHKFLTLWYISNLIKNKGFNFSYIDNFEKNKVKFFLSVEEYDVGKREIYIQPEYISSLKKFGFVMGFHFRNSKEFSSVREQQLSFSLTLDKFPKANVFYNQNFRMFLSSNFKKKIIPLLNEINMMVVMKPFIIDEHQLANCFYSNNEREDISNFSLMKKYEKIKKSEIRACPHLALHQINMQAM